MYLFSSVDQIILTYGDEEYIQKFTKKGSETDIHYYNSKIQGNGYAFLYPFKYPERIQPLVNAASVANKVILNVETVDRTVGEFLLAVDYYGIRDIGIVGGDDVFETLQKISSTMDVKMTHLQNDFGNFENFVSREVPVRAGNAMVVVDQSFSVKGVGTVILGFVISGEIRKHMHLSSYPSGKKVEIRSIQIMDVDFETAVPYSRVGLAVKGVEPEEVSKGTILHEDELQFSDSIRLDVRVNPSIKNRTQLGEKIQLNFLFSNVNAEVSDVSDGRYLIDTERKVPIAKINYALTSLNSTPRISGVGRPAD